MPDVAAVIDLGGDNTYYEGTVAPDRPVLLVINLAGNNVFRGDEAGHAGRRDPRRVDAAGPGAAITFTRPRTSPRARPWPASAS